MTAIIAMRRTLEAKRYAPGEASTAAAGGSGGRPVGKTNRLLGIGLLFAGLLAIYGCTKSAVDHAKKGAEYYQANRYQEALIEYRNATAQAPQNVEFKYELARTYRAIGNVPSAITEYQGVLALNPDHIEAKVELANLHLNVREDAKAEPLISQVLKVRPDHAVAHSLRGQYLIRSGDTANGLVGLEKAVQLSPRTVELYEPIATFHSAKGRPDLAMEVLKKCVEANPGSTEAHLNLAQFQFLQRQVGDAEKSARRAISLNTRHIKANLFLAQILTVTSRNQEAESVLTLVKGIAPSDPVAYRALSVFYETTGQRDKAIAELKSLEKSQFRDLVVKQRLVENLLAAGRLDEAEAINRAIKKASPKSAYPLYTEGRLRVARKEVQAAIASFNEAIAIEANPDYYHNLGMAQASVGLIKQARESLQQALNQDPRRVDSLLALATLALGSGNQGFALQAANQTLKRDPNSSDAKILRAHALFAGGQAQEGERMLEEVLAKDPVTLPALGLLVDLKVSQGKSREMEERLAVLTSKKSSIAELHLLLGIVRSAHKDLDGSEKSLREAIRLKPNVKAAREVLANVLQEKGDRPAVQKTLRAAIEADPNNLANYLRLAAECEKDKKLDEAISTLAAGRKVDPSSPILANYYAYLLLEAGGDANLALSLAQQAKEKMPTSPEVADTLGWAYYKRGMYDQAVRQFKFAIHGRPTEPAFFYHLGETYIAMKNWTEAKNALSKSLANPTFADRAKAEAALKRISE